MERFLMFYFLLVSTGIKEEKKNRIIDQGHEGNKKWCHRSWCGLLSSWRIGSSKYFCYHPPERRKRESDLPFGFRFDAIAIFHDNSFSLNHWMFWLKRPPLPRHGFTGTPGLELGALTSQKQCQTLMISIRMNELSKTAFFKLLLFCTNRLTDEWW